MRIGLGLGVNKGRKSGFVQDAAITALLDQASTDGYTAFSGSTLVAANTLVTDLKSAGIWDKLDLFYVFATNGDEAFARYNWKDPSAFQCTEVGAGALTYTTLEGFTGDGTNYLDTGWNPTSISTQYSLDNASFGFYDRTSNITVGSMGSQGSTQTFLHNRDGSSSVFRVNANSSSSISVSPTDGFWHADRSSSASMQLYRNGSQIKTDNIVSNIVANANFVIMNSFAGSSTKQISIAFTGSSLSGEVSSFYDAVQSYMTTLGTQV